MNLKGLRKRFWIAGGCIIALVIVIFSYVKSEAKPEPVTNQNGFTNISNKYRNKEDVFKKEYQEQVHKNIEQMKEKYNYSIQHPLLIINPYSTITNGVYVYFKSDDSVSVEYTMSADGYADYTQKIYSGETSGVSTEHESTLIGAIHGKQNTLTLTSYDKEGNVVETSSFSFKAPATVGKADQHPTEVKNGESTKGLTNGLFCTSSQGNEFVGMYDNDGVLRGELLAISYPARRIIEKDGYLYMCVSTQKMIRMDRTGYIDKVYQIDSKYKLHHDYIFGKKNDILILGTRVDYDSASDLILRLDIDTGKIVQVIDFRNLLPNYYKMTKISNNADQNDWLHFNSLVWTDDGKLLASSRETSTVICLKDIYKDKVSISYMIGSDQFWKGTGYEKLVYKKQGDFSAQGGQHGLIYSRDDSLKKGQYFLTMFNNNNTFATTRTDYDWFKDSNYSGTGASTINPVEFSYYYRYLVDTNKKTFSLVESIPIAYSPYVSNVQNFDNGNRLIESGANAMVEEVDEKGVLIRSIKFYCTAEYTMLYRVFKYDFNGFWFEK
ncbi:arylsulfate sulfotransferase [Lachnospiraceae bacterium KM106-2]|nr:arylsulfate sulfotransferase [Lachnospiraceae bacterium KM106-2]